MSPRSPGTGDGRGVLWGASRMGPENGRATSGYPPTTFLLLAAVKQGISTEQLARALSKVG
jgi:hypothetical protein